MAGLPWFALLFLAYGAAPVIPPAISMAAGLALAGLVLFVVARWSRSPEWDRFPPRARLRGDDRQYAGRIPRARTGPGPAIDVVGKLVLNAVAAGWLVSLARRMGSRLTTA